MKTTAYILTILLLSPLAEAGSKLSQCKPLRAPAAVKPAPMISYQDVQNLIPTNMQATTDGRQVSQAIARRGVNKTFKTAFSQNTSIGKQVEAAQNSLKTDVAIETDDVDHKVDMKVHAFQSEAMIKYSGLFNAEAVYNALDDNLDIHMDHDLGDSTHLQVRHETKLKTSSVNVSWSF